MQNIPDVHAGNRVIPQGKVLLANTMPKGESFGRVHVLDEKRPQSAAWRNRVVRLIAVEAGWALAGAALRWDNGYFAVRWKSEDGTTYGQRYRTFDEASHHFNRIA